ncbi:hypothetical protein CDD83_9380 [Cordyceps sp. RAO-2017]|nr:hypothetical protein CDD83_9380 [Cordyceps sp. RAO-2017]
MAAPFLFLLLTVALSAHATPTSRPAASDLSSRSLQDVDRSMMGTLPVATFKRRSLAWRLRQQEQQQGGGQQQEEEQEQQRGGEGDNEDPEPTDLGEEEIVRREAPPQPPSPDDKHVPGTLSMPIIHAKAPELRKRDGESSNTIQADLMNRADVAYYVELRIGNPGQDVRVQLDTGSFELWCNPTCTGQVGQNGNFCRGSGRYDSGQSSTATVTSEKKSLKYGIGSANVTYVRDTISIPGSSAAPMRDVQFGVADSTQDQFAGIMGVGFGQGVTLPYPSFMDQLTLQNVTKTKTLAFALGSKFDGGGAVAFGGVDRAKYAGSLAQVPIIPANRSPDKVARYWVQMQSIRHTGPDNRTSAPLPGSDMAVFFDTGATLSLLPPAVVRAMAESLGVDTARTGMIQNSFYPVDCRLLDRDGTFDFRFDGVTVFVPYKEIIRQQGPIQPGGGGNAAAAASSCYLGVMQSDKFSLLGDTFLRSAYVVFDLDKKMAYIARYSDCGSDVQSISASTRLKDMRGRCNETAVAKSRLDRGSDRADESKAPGLVPGTAFLAAVAAAAVCLLLGL